MKKVKIYEESKPKKSNGMITEGLEKDTLLEQSFPQILSDCFNRYAKMVLTDRAIPDVCDGLKPVHRRIIYDMYKNGITYDKKLVKCAKTVGDVLGNYHPHGDSSVYDAMVRLSQDWKMEVPLIVFHGNNGSIDNDPAAAYRYTEAKLTLASSFMTKDLNEDTVDMTLTFDDTNVEPVVLPAAFPNLLINGAQGIAIGNSTNIPTHNPNEVIDATIYRIENPNCTVDDLTKIILGPDFPTGGIIDNKLALKDLYATGKASFYIYSNTEIDYEKNKIIINEIPYGVIKSQMVAELDEKRIKEKIDNIEEIRDESSTDIRIVLDIKKGADPQSVLNYITAKGWIRSTFSANMLALNKGHPKTLSLLEILDAYLEHRRNVIVRRSKFRYEKYSSRLEIVNGLLKAKSIIDEIIKTIRNSQSRVEAKQRLMEQFGFTALQADAIGNMRLYSLTKIDIVELENEKKECEKQTKELLEIINSKKKLDKVIEYELMEARKALDTPRKTKIYDQPIEIKTINQKSLIAEEQVRVVFTKAGYIKRTNLRSFTSSLNSENKVENLPNIKVGDTIILNRECSTHDDVMAITDKGNYIIIPVWQIPEAKWKEEGKHVNNLVSFDTSEKIIKAFIVNNPNPGLTLIVLTSEGKIKRSDLSEMNFSKLTNRPLKCISLGVADSVIDATISSGNSSIIVMALDGNANRFNENQIPLVGLKASGVKAMNMASKPTKMAFVMSLRNGEDKKILIIGNNKRATIVNTYQIPNGDRLGAKTQVVRISAASNTKLVGLTPLFKVDGKYDSIMLALSTGSMELDISQMGVSSIGVLLRTENVTTEPSNALILGIHTNGITIDANTPIDIPPTISEKPIKAKDDGSAKQMTFFELFDEENNEFLKKDNKKDK